MVNRKEVIEFLSSEKEYYSNQVEKLAEKIAKWETKIADAQRSIVKYKNYQDNLKGSIDLIKGEMPLDSNFNPSQQINAQRRQVIQEAKELIDRTTEKERFRELLHSTFGTSSGLRVYFDIYNDTMGVGVMGSNFFTVERKTIQCHPDDVFNTHIGKAILLGRLFNFDVSKFEDAPQPTEVVEGMEIQVYYECLDDIEHHGRVLDVYENGQYVELNDSGHTVQGIDITRQNFKIIDDTNAVY